MSDPAVRAQVANGENLDLTTFGYQLVNDCVCAVLAQIRQCSARTWHVIVVEYDAARSAQGKPILSDRFDSMVAIDEGEVSNNIGLVQRISRISNMELVGESRVLLCNWVERTPRLSLALGALTVQGFPLENPRNPI